MSQRLELMQDNSIDTITFRNAPDEMALPIRRWGAFLPGEGVGGTGNPLGRRCIGASCRPISASAALLTERYGAKCHSGRHDDPGLAGQL